MLLTSELKHNHLKPPKPFFTFGMKQFNKIVLFDKDRRINTTKRRAKNIYEWKIRKNTNFDRFNHFDVVSIVLSGKNRMEYQTYRVLRSIEPHPPYNEAFEFSLEHLVLYENNHVKRMGKKPSWGLGYYDPELYKKNLSTVFKKGPMKHTGMYLGSKYYSERYENILERAYKNRNTLEYLDNINATQLYRNILNGTADMRVITRKLLTKYKFFLKQFNLSAEQVSVLKLMEGKIKLNPTNLTYLSNSNISRLDFNEFIKLTNDLERESNTLFSYLARSKISFDYYIDYLSMLKELQLFTNRKDIIMPKNIIKSHDEAATMVELKKFDDKSKEMQAVVEKTNIYNFENDKYAIINPKNIGDIIYEGKTLKHCVWSDRYVNSHVEGKTVILFIRNKNNLEKPNYTLEYKNNKVIQIRGVQNKSAPPEIQEFIEEWKTYLINEERKKINAKNTKRNKPSYSCNKETEQYRQATG